MAKFFNNMSLSEYNDAQYKNSVNGDDIPINTVLTVCKNHSGLIKHNFAF